MRATRRTTMRAAAVAIICLAGALAAGCGGGAAGQAAVGRRFPEAEFMVASATSTEGQADAEARARAALAAQIRSRISSVLTSELQEESRDGVSSSMASTRSDIVQEAAFDRMELMRVDEASRRHAGGLHHATVYLSRDEARAVLRTDYTDAAARLAREAAPLTGVPDHDLPGFATRYATVRRAYATVEARAMELRAITGALPAGFVASRDLWYGAEAERMRRLEGLRLAVAVAEPIPAGDPIDRASLRQDVVHALGAAGLAVRGDACADAPYLLVIQPRLWHQGMLGVVSRLSLAGHLQDCRSGDRWEIELMDEAWVSEAARADEAVRKVQKLVDAATLRRHLVEALADHLPLR